jgi:hypothetical protein
MAMSSQVDLPVGIRSLGWTRRFILRHGRGTVYKRNAIVFECEIASQEMPDGRVVWALRGGGVWVNHSDDKRTVANVDRFPGHTEAECRRAGSVYNNGENSLIKPMVDEGPSTYCSLEAVHLHDPEEWRAGATASLAEVV